MAQFTFKLRRGTAAQWTASNPVLQDGEPGVETDTFKLKVGDGITPWANLPYNSEESIELGPAELDQVAEQVMGELEIQDLVLLWENAKA